MYTIVHRSVVFVNTNPKNERIAVLKSNESLGQLDDSDTNVFQKSLIDSRGGSRIDGRGVQVRLASCGLRTQARQLGGSVGMPPQENCGFQEF